MLGSYRRPSEDCTIRLIHAASKVPIPDNEAVEGEVDGIAYSYLSGRTVRPEGTAGALVDTVKGIFASIGLLISPSRRPNILVLYTPGLIKFLLPVLVAKLLGIPILTDVCEVRTFSTDIDGKGVIRRLVNSGDSLLERMLPRISFGLLVISERIREYYLRRGMSAEGMYLLPVLVEPALFDGSSDEPVQELRDSIYLLNSGAFNEKDGLAYLVRSVARVRDDHPGLKLVFTGNATEEVQDTILRLAGEQGCKWIVFTGYLARKQLLGCYQHAAGLLSCRSNSEYANYGFPTKLAEYLAVGRPVVATRVGDVCRYLQDGNTAFLAQPENIEDIAAAIRRLLDDPGSADRVGLRGAEVARRNFNYVNHANAVSRFVRTRAGL